MKQNNSNKKNNNRTMIIALLPLSFFLLCWSPQSPVLPHIVFVRVFVYRRDTQEKASDALTSEAFS